MNDEEIDRLGDQFKRDHRCPDARPMTMSVRPVFLDRRWGSVGGADNARRITCDACGEEWESE